jgi:c-di-GMP-binding flagellar brake protein YcgR
MTITGSEKPPRPSRRLTQRHRLDIRLKVTILRESGVVLLNGRSNDISENGLGAAIPGELAMDEVIHLEFFIPLHKHVMKLRAAVKRRDGYHYGLEFLTLSAAQRAAIHKLCQSLPLCD